MVYKIAIENRSFL